MNISLTTKNPTLSRVLFILWAGGCALLCYSLVYALRKPFTGATFDGITVWGFSYKSVVTISHIIGYLISKFAGIRIISELNRAYRLRFIAAAVLLAEAALILFGLLPIPYNLIAMFINGLALGCMWGLIFTFIEGRRVTDILASLLGISIVISSGMAKSVGLFVMNQLHVDPFWTPALIGGFAAPLVIVMGWMLSRLPKPTPEDIALKSERTTLDHSQRKAVFRSHALLLTVLLSANLMLMILRDIKEDFLVNIFDVSAYSDWIFAQVDTVVTLIILGLFGVMVLVRDNKKAIYILLGGVSVASVGMALISGNYEQWGISPLMWLLAQSLCLYIPYLTFQTLFFDRFIACFRIRGSAGFFIALVDFIGYSGTVLVLLLKEILHPQANWLQLYNQMALYIGITGTIAFLISMWLVRRTSPAESTQEAELIPSGFSEADTTGIEIPVPRFFPTPQPSSTEG